MKQTIAESLDKVSDAAEHLVDAERKSRRRANWIIAFVFLLGLVAWRWDGHLDCVSANARRADLRDAFHYLAEFSVPDGSPPAKVARRDEFTAGIDARLPARPCRMLPELW